MSSTIGTVPAFDPGQITFDEWLEILEAWIEANKVEDGLKRSVLFTSMGTKAYHVLRSLFQPDKPKDKSYAECVTMLKGHFMPQTSEIVLRYKFNTRVQKTGETVSKFVAELRRLSDGCKFTDLSSMLRDRLVVGVSEVAIQRKLLSEKDLTFDKALSIATAMETANKNLQDIKQSSSVTPPNTTSVNKLHYKGSKKPDSKFKPQQTTVKLETKDSKHHKRCWRCGTVNHEAKVCPFKEDKCYKCSTVGHTKSQCDRVQAYQKKHAKSKKPSASAHYLDEQSSSGSEDESYLMHILDCAPAVHKLSEKPITIQLLVNHQPVSLELDTGSPWSIISQELYNSLEGLPPIKPKSIKLSDYNGALVNIVGTIDVNVQMTANNDAIQIPLLISARGANLCGRDWIAKLSIPINEAIDSAKARDSTSTNKPLAQLSHISNTESLADILQEEAELFDTSVLGKLKGYQAKVYPMEDAKPLFYKASSLAYTTKAKVDAALDDLLHQGVIEPVKYADYACPLVIAKKPDGNIRICGNYKLTANKVLRLEKYPIPSLEDLLQSLQGGTKFSKLDLSHAYHQIELEPEARPFTTVNTHRGLFQFCRLSFGIASAPAIFQRTMEALIGDIPMCKAYLDDLIISGRSDEEHLKNLKLVLTRLREHGLRLRKDKCSFLQDSLNYLGHRLDATGLKPEVDKVKAVKEAPEPSNQAELQSFLGLLGYYRKFIPNLSKHIAPLHELLGNNTKFRWGTRQQKAFELAKQLLSSDTLLVHFNPDLPVLLQSDASPYGLGSVISHVLPNGQERPIAYASRTLTSSEKNYAQYEREALSIVFGLTKFHKYLHGRPFTIVTDHELLI